MERKGGAIEKAKAVNGREAVKFHPTEANARPENRGETKPGDSEGFQEPGSFGFVNSIFFCRYRGFF
jgi:hypothetical protein